MFEIIVGISVIASLLPMTFPHDVQHLEPKA